jgi:hypothetical protein
MATRAHYTKEDKYDEFIQNLTKHGSQISLDDLALGNCPDQCYIHLLLEVLKVDTPTINKLYEYLNWLQPQIKPNAIYQMKDNLQANVETVQKLLNELEYNYFNKKS